MEFAIDYKAAIDLLPIEFSDINDIWDSDSLLNLFAFSVLPIGNRSLFWEYLAEFFVKPD